MRKIPDQGSNPRALQWERGTLDHQGSPRPWGGDTLGELVTDRAGAEGAGRAVRGEVAAFGFEVVVGAVLVQAPRGQH